MYAQSVLTYYQITVSMQDKTAFTASIPQGTSNYHYRWISAGY